MKNQIKTGLTILVLFVAVGVLLQKKEKKLLDSMERVNATKQTISVEKKELHIEDQVEQMIKNHQSKRQQLQQPVVEVQEIPTETKELTKVEQILADLKHLDQNSNETETAQKRLQKLQALQTILAKD